ncbi:MAG: hypothetical protein IT429_16320 [Gemmataceae bacterium]|nr:hypothetical protein [Gemmataceae bacterium]
MSLDLTTPLGVEVDDWDCRKQGIYCPNCEEYIRVELDEDEISTAIQDCTILVGKEGDGGARPVHDLLPARPQVCGPHQRPDRVTEALQGGRTTPASSSGAPPRTIVDPIV